MCQCVDTKPQLRFAFKSRWIIFSQNAIPKMRKLGDVGPAEGMKGLNPLP